MATTHPRDKSQSRTAWVKPFTDQPLSRLRFARSRDDALIGGVAGGLGERWGVEPVLVRIAFVVLSYAGAIGVIAYIAAWSISVESGDRRAGKAKPPDAMQGAAFGAVVLGAVVLLRAVGLWLGDAVGVPLLIGAVGAAVVYVGAGQQRRPRWTRGGRALHNYGARPSFISLIVGGIFVMGGVTWFLIINRSFNGFFAVVVAVGVTTIGLAIVFGPWVYRLANQVGEERRDRIRSEERAELAAHLHDSVLQTLALIQRNAGNPRKMASLARRQERELRTWLYGDHVSAAQLENFMAMLEQIEDSYEVSIETIVVGNAALGEDSEAVALACLEAATNAARHSGADEISVYIECEPDAITAFVRDRGRGFDPGAVSNGRRGIADSIRGRIERHGGTVTITSAPDDGCEVQIVMPTRKKS